MKRKVRAGIASLSLPVFIQSTASTAGAGLGSVTHATSGFIAEYRRQGQSSWTSITLVSKTLGTYTSGGFVADGSLDGAYEFDPPDAAVAAGARFVVIRLRGAANMLSVLIEIELDAVDYQTDAFGALKPTTAGHTLDVSAGGEAGIDLANVGSPSTTLNLSGTTIKTATDVEADTQDIQSRLPASLDAGRIVVTVGAYQSGNAPLQPKIAGRTLDVTGSHHAAAVIHGLQPAVIADTHFAPGAIDANALAADGIAEIQSGLAMETSVQSVLNRIGNFAGSGVNTILGFFRALMRKDGSITTPSDVGGAYSHATDSTEAIRDRGDAAWTTGGGGGGSTTVNVLPYTGAVPDRVEGTTIKVFYNELTNVSVGVTDATGTAVALDAKTLRFCVEDRYGVDVLTLNDGSITRSGSTFTLQIPQSLTDTVGANYRWSLRDLTSSLNTVLIHGQLIVAEAAEDEA